ncbi:MAG: hypothetical protein QM737_02895 [Ferruginibacter sp.]
MNESPQKILKSIIAQTKVLKISTEDKMNQLLILMRHYEALNLQMYSAFMLIGRIEDHNKKKRVAKSTENKTFKEVKEAFLWNATHTLSSLKFKL